MPEIKEFREFFLRATKVTSGSRPDKEIPFPVQYTVNGSNRYNRFLKDHAPSEKVFKKLFESIENGKVLIIDDIFTSGTTIVEMFNLLKQYAPKEINGFVLIK